MKGKKYGGRTKGTPNKTTVINRNIITSMLSEYSESGQMSDDFDALEPKDRLTIAEKMMQYVMPKIQSVDIGLNGSESKITIEAQLKELAEEK